MPRSRIPIDGLWQCLNPSIDAACLARLSQISIGGTLPTATRHPCRDQRPRLRSYTTTSRSCSQARAQERVAPISVDTFDRLLRQAHTPVKGSKGQRRPPLVRHDVSKKQEWGQSNSSSGEDGQSLAQDLGLPIQESNVPIVEGGHEQHADMPGQADGRQPGESMLRIKGKYLALHLAHTDLIYSSLHRTRGRGTKMMRHVTCSSVKHLIRRRAQPADSIFFYETLLMAQCVTEGSAEAVGALIEEMREKKIGWTATAYNAALMALAVHPDYVVRNELLADMRSRWVQVDPEGHVYIAIGLLRDGQYEMALEKLESMIADRIAVPSWLYDIYIYVLAELGHVEDALRIVQHRLDNLDGDISVNVWFYLLDACSRVQHLEGCRYIWRRTVTARLVVPSEGIVTSILNTAARHGDSEFAADAIEYLVAAGTQLRSHHYEALSESYAAQGKIKEAIEVLATMGKNRLRATRENMGAIVQCLRQNPGLVTEAVRTIQSIISVPIALFNAVLAVLLDTTSFERGLELYRSLDTWGPGKADEHTYLLLLQKCTSASAGDALFEEIRASGEQITWMAYKELLRIHLAAADGSLTVAVDCFDRIMALESSVTRRSAFKAEVSLLMPLLIRRLEEANHDEAGRVSSIAHACGLPEDSSERR